MTRVSYIHLLLFFFAYFFLLSILRFQNNMLNFSSCWTGVETFLHSVGKQFQPPNLSKRNKTKQKQKRERIIGFLMSNWRRDQKVTFERNGLTVLQSLWASNINEFTTLMTAFPAIPKNLRLAFLEPVVLLINLIYKNMV